jgi:hypothetical protein
MSVLLSSLRFLPLEPAQLSLAAVLRNGQCFLWKKARARATLSQIPAKTEDEGLYEWFYGHKDRTIVLRQDGKASATCKAWIWAEDSGFG